MPLGDRVIDSKGLYIKGIDAYRSRRAELGEQLKDVIPLSRGVLRFLRLVRVYAQTDTILNPVQYFLSATKRGRRQLLAEKKAEQEISRQRERGDTRDVALTTTIQECGRILQDALKNFGESGKDNQFINPFRHSEFLVMQYCLEQLLGATKIAHLKAIALENGATMKIGSPEKAKFDVFLEKMMFDLVEMIRTLNPKKYQHEEVFELALGEANKEKKKKSNKPSLEEVRKRIKKLFPSKGIQQEWALMGYGMNSFLGKFFERIKDVRDLKAMVDGAPTDLGNILGSMFIYQEALEGHIEEVFRKEEFALEVKKYATTVLESILNQFGWGVHSVVKDHIAPKIPLFGRLTKIPYVGEGFKHLIATPITLGIALGSGYWIYTHTEQILSIPVLSTFKPAIMYLLHSVGLSGLPLTAPGLKNIVELPWELSDLVGTVFGRARRKGGEILKRTRASVLKRENKIPKVRDAI